MSSFAVQLKAIRKERGLTQKDLASMLEIANTTVANYEQGTRFPDEAVLRGIADTLNVSLDKLLGGTPDSPGAAPGTVSADSSAYLEYILEGNAGKAQTLLWNTLEAGAGVADLYLTILQPALREVGRRWEAGDLDIDEEHQFTETTERIMAWLMADVPVNFTGPAFIGFCIAPEPHKIGMRMVTDLLTLDGWRGVFLGVDLPASSIISAVERHGARLVGISAAMNYHINPVATMIQAIKSADLDPAPQIMVGGQAFNRDKDLWLQVGADGFSADAGAAVSTARELLSLSSGATGTSEEFRRHK